ncbi:hypothetical protein N7528_005158 [Penicillium herquei]|nr:hypothetical protein N7528_005158 [Penicillium herquei]
MARGVKSGGGRKVSGAGKKRGTADEQRSTNKLNTSFFRSEIGEKDEQPPAKRSKTENPTPAAVSSPYTSASLASATVFPPLASVASASAGVSPSQVGDSPSFAIASLAPVGVALPLAGVLSISPDNPSPPLATVASASAGVSVSVAGDSPSLAIRSSASAGASIAVAGAWSISTGHMHSTGSASTPLIDTSSGSGGSTSLVRRKPLLEIDMNVRGNKWLTSNAVIPDTEDEGSEFDDLYDDEYTSLAHTGASHRTKVDIELPEEGRTQDPEQLDGVEILTSDSEYEFDDLYDASDEEGVIAPQRTKRTQENERDILEVCLKAHKNDTSRSDTRISKALMVAVHILKDYALDEQYGSVMTESFQLVVLNLTAEELNAESRCFLCEIVQKGKLKLFEWDPSWKPEANLEAGVLLCSQCCGKTINPNARHCAIPGCENVQSIRAFYFWNPAWGIN